MSNSDYDHPEIMDILGMLERYEIDTAIFGGELKISNVATQWGMKYAIHTINCMGQQGSGIYNTVRDDAYLDAAIAYERMLKSVENRKAMFPDSLFHKPQTWRLSLLGHEVKML